MKKIGTLLALLFVFLTITRPVHGQEDIDVDHIKRSAESFVEMNKKKSPSGSLGIFKDGKIIYQTQYGYIDEEEKVLAGPETIYEWGSVSKVLVWVSVMQLVEEGKIDLEADIKTYLPKDFVYQLSYPYPISLLNIMNLQSGFQEVSTKVEFKEGEEIPPLKDLLLKSQPIQIYNPGTVTAYNNWTPALAAYVVECVTGQDFYAYVRDHIFKPLGMDHTALRPDWTDNDFVRENREKSKSYYYSFDRRDSLGPSILHIGLYPAGAVAGTFSDFLTFVKEFTNDHPRFFKDPKTFEKMMEPSVFYSNGLPRTHHGLLSIDYGDHLAGHPGNTQGFTSSFWFEPKSGLGYGVMVNQPGESTYNYSLAHSLFKRKDLLLPGGEDLTGLYTNMRTIEEGPLRFSKYLAGILPISREEEEGTFGSTLAATHIDHQGDSNFLFSTGGNFAYNVVAKDEGDILESFTSDFKRLGMGELLMAYGLIIAALLYLIAMIRRVLVWIFNILRTKPMGFVPYGFLSKVAATIISASFVYLWLLTDSYSSGKIKFVCFLSIGASLIIIGNFLVNLIKDLRGEENVLRFVRWPLLMVAFVIFFDFYKFWI